MKGAQGLIIAAILGLFGIALNWYYLSTSTQGRDLVSFLAVRGDPQKVTIKRGTVIKESDLLVVEISKENAGNLKHFVYLEADLGTVVGTKATRDYVGGEYVFRRDYTTVPPRVDLKPGYEVIFVPVTSQSFVPSLFNPGDQIKFIVRNEDAKASQPEEFGPFDVYSLGNRLANDSVMKGSGKKPVQQNDIGIIVRTGDRDHEELKTLLSRLGGSNREILGVSHAGRRKK